MRLQLSCACPQVSSVPPTLSNLYYVTSKKTWHKYRLNGERKCGSSAWADLRLHLYPHRSWWKQQYLTTTCEVMNAFLSPNIFFRLGKKHKGLMWLIKSSFSLSLSSLSLNSQMHRKSVVHHLLLLPWQRAKCEGLGDLLSDARRHQRTWVR